MTLDPTGEIPGSSGTAPAAPPLPGKGSIRGPAIRGSIWTMGGYAGGQLLKLLSNVILARLLFPEVYGQVALVYTFITGLMLFTDVGAGPAIVQNPRGDDPRFLNTVWTISCIRGVLLWIAAWAIAVPVASFYGQPLLAWLIPAAGFSSVTDGFTATSVHQARRHMRFERLTIMNVASQVLGSVVTIGLAFTIRSFCGPNDPRAVWAVVAGGLTVSFSYLVFSYTVLPHIRHRFEFDRAAVRSYAKLGRWIFLSTMLSFLAGPTDRLVLGKMIPLSMLGIYGIAAALAVVPLQAVSRLGNSVVFPAYSRLQERGDFRQVFGRVRLPLLLGGALVVTGLIASGPFLILVLYDRRYADAAWIIQFLGAMTWFQILENANASALLAKGRADWMAAGNGAKLAGMVVFLWLGFAMAGFPGALLGLVLAEAMKYAISANGIARCGLPVLAQDMVFTAVIAAVSWAGFAIGSEVSARFQSNLLAFLAAGTLAAGFWAAVVLRFWSQGRFRAPVAE